MSIPPPGPLSYEGQVALPFINRTSNPPAAASVVNEPFEVPTIWCNTASGNAWMLTQNPNGAANWQQINNGGGSGTVITLTGNTGLAVGPTGGGNINVIGNTNTIGIDGVPGTNTLTASLVLPAAGVVTTTGVAGSALGSTAITQHDVLVGGVANAITSVAPTATLGIPLVSAGAAVDPAFGTATVPGGGTGIVTAGTHLNAPICSGTTATGAFQIADANIATAGFVFTSTGAGTVPTWQAATSTPTGISDLKVNRFVVNLAASPYTYTPSAGMVYADIEVIGAGGGGGGVATGANAGAGGGGGGGGYARKIFSAADIGASKIITIGAGGAGGAAGFNPGTGGGTTSINTAAPMQATGGSGGAGALSGTTYAAGGAGGAGSGGNFQTVGATGEPGDAAIGSTCTSGSGGATFFGGNGEGVTNSNAGSTATSYGGGGSGGASAAAGGNVAGGDGFDGYAIITEYVNTTSGAGHIVSANNAALVTCTTELPYDNTIPQQAEGDEIITVTITPKSATNILLIEFNTFGAAATLTGVAACFALFQDATAGALAATIGISVASEQAFNASLIYKMVAGTTSATTFKARCGPGNAGANQFIYINGYSGGVIFGGVANTTLTVTELSP